MTNKAPVDLILAALFYGMKTFTIAETAKRAGVPVHALLYHRRKGYVPEPSTIVGARKHYTEAEAKKIKDHFSLSMGTIRRNAGLITIGHAAERLGICQKSLYKLIEVGTVPAPTHRPGGRARYFEEADLPAIENALSAKRLKKPRSDRATEAGFYSIKVSATRLRMPLVTLRSWLDRGLIAPPTTTMAGFVTRHPFYTEDDLRAIRQIQKDYFVRRILMA